MQTPEPNDPTRNGQDMLGKEPEKVRKTHGGPKKKLRCTQDILTNNQQLQHENKLSHKSKENNLKS